ncbi:hypothetical protein [Streptomyces buecherae]|uniref:hypothetical protein n=1 Tax=Streptomyces buecherae TaxID=2763006 RepID=UPI00364AD4D0
MMLQFIVGLMLFGLVVFVAYKDQKLGAALGIGLATLGMFFIVLDRDPSAAATPPVAPSVSPPQSLPPGSATP